MEFRHTSVVKKKVVSWLNPEGKLFLFQLGLSVIHLGGGQLPLKIGEIELQFQVSKDPNSACLLVIAW